MTDDFTPDGYDVLAARVQPSVSEVDAEVRAKLTGEPVATIAERAEAAFATIGVQLSGKHLSAYAEAVRTGSAFEIELITEH